MVIMARNDTTQINYAPLYIHSFKLQPKQILKCLNPQTVSDKLCFYRLQKGLLQKEVADFAGIDRRTYSHYEKSDRDYYPIENMEKLAELYGVPVTELLDEYNLFLYNGQGKQIKALRERKNITQKNFAELLGVTLGMVKKWEQEKSRISKREWEKIKKIGGTD